MKKTIAFFFILCVFILLFINFRTPFMRDNAGPWSIGFGTSKEFPNKMHLQKDKIYSLESLKKIQPKTQFLADPFLIEHESKTYCFVEDFEYRAKRGKISCFEVYDNKFSDISVCLEETFHLSFPFVFKYNNELYMCPETCDSDQIRVYKAVNFPFEWKLEKVIMDNVRAADTLLFEKEGKWWMLTNIDPSRIGDNSSELYLFYSNSPLSTEWTPHKLNR